MPPFPDPPGEADRVSRDLGPMQRATPRIRPPSTGQPQATSHKLPFSRVHAGREAGLRLLPILERRGRFQTFPYRSRAASWAWRTSTGHELQATGHPVTTRTTNPQGGHTGPPLRRDGAHHEPRARNYRPQAMGCELALLLALAFAGVTRRGARGGGGNVNDLSEKLRSQGRKLVT